MSPLKVDLLIGNEAVATRSYAEVRDPGRFADVVGLVAEATVEEVDRAVKAAHAAFPAWSATTLEQRSAQLEKVAQLVESIVDRVAAVVVGETGMLLSEIKAETIGSAFAIRDNIEAAQEFLKPKQVEDEASWVSVEKVPIGVIAAFVPWNAPIVLMMRKLAPALLSGNTIVIKSPPQAPLGLGFLLTEIAALFPAGVINAVHGGNAVGQALAAHPLIGKISFTGGGKAATEIMKAAAIGIKGVQFELGGNDPAIVLDDADLDRLMPTLVAGAFHRSGQFCFAIKRIYVPEAMYDRFFERMGQELAKARVGHQADARTTFGPVNNANQFAYVKALVERARTSGCEVTEYGEKVDPERWDEGYYLRPALVRRPNAKSEIVTCEQFGPVVPILAYDSEDEVVAMANDTEYGLGSSVWTSSFERGVAVARQIESGMTFINRNAQSRLGRRYMPFGGVKQSGIGTENSELGMAEYVEYHAINYHK